MAQDNISLTVDVALSLAEGFANPPPSAKPRVWWHWFSGNVSVEGAELDLRWMHRVGIGGVHAFSGGGFPEAPLVEPLLPFMSEGWRAAMKRSVELANELGMEMGITGSAGWSQTGGIHVPPEEAMKKYVWSVTEIDASTTSPSQTVALPTATGPLQGVAKPSRARQLSGDVSAPAFAIAFPTPAAEQRPRPAITSSAGPDILAPLQSDLSAEIALPLDREGGTWIQAQFAEPTCLSALTVAIAEPVDIELMASDSGEAFRSVGRFSLVAGATPVDHPSPQQTLAFEATTATCFRALLVARTPNLPLPDLPVFLSMPAATPTVLSIRQFRFETGARVQRFEAKAGFEPTLDEAYPTPSAPLDAIIRSADIINITDHIDADGAIDWAPATGSWTVLRFGWSLTGATNAPAEEVATGLEVDKLDAKAVRRYIEFHLDEYAAATDGQLGPDGIHALVTDSWEAGVQNWTPELLALFEQRRGYDPVPFCPVLAGRVVDSAETSDRFLWDFRLTLKELIADTHYGVLAQALHERGMAYYTEVQGDNPRAIGDSMTMKARSDIPTGEYWYRPFGAGPGQFSLKADLEEAASASHVYGRPFAAAESLTVAAGRDPWAFSPRILKPVMDEIFARGINRVLMHDSRHQPLVDAKPGLMLLMFGQFFNRNDTWAEEAGAWVSYLARTSFLLQQGRYVADVAYFYGEDRNLTELMRRHENADVPSGYSYDYINPEALFDLLSVEDGRIVTPSGMSYRVLFLPDHVDHLTLRAAEKLRDLVRAGAVIVGARPIGALGLSASDDDVGQIIGEIWGDDGIADGAVGAGRVYSNLETAFQAEGVAPDVTFQTASGRPRILKLHRRTDEADIYFLSSQEDTALDVQATFRVSGKAPEIWRAEDGSGECPAYRPGAAGGITVDLHLEAHEAIFVVFQSATDVDQEVEAGLTSETGVTIEGPWTVQFEPGRGAPAETTFERLQDWSSSADPGVRFFSGRAVYKRTVAVPVDALGEGLSLLLDLGEVRELAVVSVNGVVVGTAWRPPYRIDITHAVRPGDNEFEIKVVNLWPNRLIGDQQPDAEPVAFAPFSPYTSDSPLLPSGLIGPVQLISRTDGKVSWALGGLT